MKKQNFYAQSASNFTIELVKQLTQIDSIEQISFGDKFVTGKAQMIDGCKVFCKTYTQKRTGKEMVGFEVIATPVTSETK